MKEYEKLAEEFAGNMDVWADDWKKAYITGFLKAREMCLEVIKNTSYLDFNDLYPDIKELGEKEV